MMNGYLEMESTRIFSLARLARPRPRARYTSVWIAIYAVYTSRSIQSDQSTLGEFIRPESGSFFLSWIYMTKTD